MDPLDLDFPLPPGQRFNLLNVSDNVYLHYMHAEVGFFRSVNGPWIDQAVVNRVPVIAVSDVSQYLYKLEDSRQSLTGYGKEVHRLEHVHGYRYDVLHHRFLPGSQLPGVPALTKLDDYTHDV